MQLGLTSGRAASRLVSKMRQRRSKNALTLQFEERDYLPTIIEGQPINIGIPPSLKLSLLGPTAPRRKRRRGHGREYGRYVRLRLEGSGS